VQLGGETGDLLRQLRILREEREVLLGHRTLTLENLRLAGLKRRFALNVGVTVLLD
jgi:hypothetical protein